MQRSSRKTTFRLSIGPLLFGVLIVFAAGAPQAAGAASDSLAGPERPAPRAPVIETDVVRETFTVRPGGTLHVNVGQGNVIVETGAGDAVRVEVRRTVHEGDEREVLERHHVSIEKRGNDVIVEARMEEDGGGGFWRWWDNAGSDRLEVQVHVQVPRRYSVDFETGAGNVEIAALEGTVRGTTGAGNVLVDRIDGPVHLTTGAGNVEVDGASEVSVKTGAGNVSLGAVRGYVTAKTGAGNISAHITRQPEAPSELSSGTGNVTVYVPAHVGLEVDASAGIGSAETDFPLSVEDGWMSTSFAGTLGDGGPALRLSAGMGNVALRKH